MNINLHPSANRGLSAHGWLVSRFSFSFSNYYDPNRMGFGPLRVLNDDLIAPDSGFDTHHHDNMEIITIVTAGTLTHQDSTGGQGTVTPGEIQIMSAGTGINHSEFNHDPDKYLKLLQIWIEPDQQNLPPRYEQKFFDPALRHNQFQTIVSPNQENNSLKIFQQNWFSLANLEANKQLIYNIKKPHHGLFIFIIEGQITVTEFATNNPKTDLPSDSNLTEKTSTKPHSPLSAQTGDSLEITQINTSVQILAQQNSQILFIEVSL